MKNTLLPRIHIPAIATVAVLVLAQPIHAASQTWVGNGTDGNWSTGANWSGGAAPGNTTTTTNADTATFNATITNTWGDSTDNPIVIDSTTQNIKSLTFTGNTGNYFVGSTGGNPLLLSSGGILSISNNATLTASNATLTLNAPLVIENASGAGNGTYTISNNSQNGTGPGTATLNIGGTISGAATSGNITTLLIRGNRGTTGSDRKEPNTISGAIGDGVAGGQLALHVGQGQRSTVWVLTANNTFSGNLTLESGSSILRVADDSNLGQGANIFINQNSDLNTTASFTTGKNIFFSGGAPGIQADPGTSLTVNGMVSNLGDTGKTGFPIQFTGGGAITLNNGSNNFTTGNGTIIRVQNSSTLNLGHASAINGAALQMALTSTGTLDNTSGADMAAAGLTAFEIGNTGFTFTGTHSLDLSGVDAGFVNTANATRTITVAANTLTIGGIKTTGNDTVNIARVDGALAKDGAGTLVIDGVSDYTGNTTVTAGVLSLSGGNAIPDANTLIIAGGKANLAANETVGVLVLGNTTQGNNTYGSSSSAATVQDDTNFSGTGVLTVGDGVPSGVTFASWAAGYGLNGSLTDNFDTDKFTDGEEYAFDLDPTVAEYGNELASQTALAGGNITLTLAFFGNSSKSDINYVVRRANNPSFTDNTVVGHWNGTANWTTSNSTYFANQTQSGAGDVQAINVNMEIPAATEPRQFLKVDIE